MSLFLTVPGLFQSPVVVRSSRHLTPAWQYAFAPLPQAVGLLSTPVVREDGTVDEGWLNFWGELGVSAALLKTPMVTMLTGRMTGDWQRFLQQVEV